MKLLLEILITLLATASASLAAYTYECGRYYDCVTPFTSRVRTQLPAADTIPYPAALDPATIETPMSPIVSNAWGKVAGIVGVRVSSPLPFLYTPGGLPQVLLDDSSYVVRDLSDDGTAILQVGGTGTVFLWDGGGAPVGLSFVYGETAIYYVQDFIAFGKGGAMLLTGDRLRLDLSLDAPDLRLLYSPIKLARIPEPGAAGLFFATALAVGLRLVRPSPNTR